MNSKKALFIALGPIAGITIAQYVSGDLTWQSFALYSSVAIAGALFMTFVSSIGKSNDEE